jgi:hypothetical protein
MSGGDVGGERECAEAGACLVGEEAVEFEQDAVGVRVEDR